jgi:hypothetical protein
LDARRQLEQAQHVGHGRTALAHSAGDVLVRQVELFDQLLVGRRFLHRVEVLTVQVLNQRLLQRGGLVDLSDDGGDGLQAGPLRRAPPPLPRDQLIAVSS